MFMVWQNNGVCGALHPPKIILAFNSYASYIVRRLVIHRQSRCLTLLIFLRETRPKVHPRPPPSSNSLPNACKATWREKPHARAL